MRGGGGGGGGGGGDGFEWDDLADEDEAADTEKAQREFDAQRDIIMVLIDARAPMYELNAKGRVRRERAATGGGSGGQRRWR